MALTCRFWIVDASYRDAAARRAACEVRQHVLDLRGELRHHASEEWDAVLAVNDEFVALDPAAADPDGLAGNAREQLTHRREAEQAEHRRQVESCNSRSASGGAAQDLATNLNARVLAIGNPDNRRRTSLRSAKPGSGWSFRSTAF